ncbi:MAG: hypothetical protein E6J82_09170 [Deltaproteobacteria bacterium]|nr:MAG: hypothetical protein E6J82_09170 [Deltaproteobacteria bacterium]
MRGSFLLASMFAFCASTPKVAPERVEAMHEAKDEETVKACTMLGRFVGSSTQAGEQGLLQARAEARIKCAASGATDFVYDSESVSPDVVTVAAKAYDCGTPK